MRFGFDDLERGINEAPITYLPALLVLVVKRSVKDGVYVPGGLQKVVANASRLATGEKLDGDLGTCRGHCTEHVPEAGCPAHDAYRLEEVLENAAQALESEASSFVHNAQPGERTDAKLAAETNDAHADILRELARALGLVETTNPAGDTDGAVKVQQGAK